MSLEAIWLWGGALSALLICLWAFWRGGPVERYGAAIILIGWALCLALDLGRKPGDPGIYFDLVDVVALLALFTLSLWSRRLWTLFATAFQLAAVAADIAAMLPRFAGYTRSYVTIVGLLGGQGLLLCLFCGVIGYRLALKRQNDPK